MLRVRLPFSFLFSKPPFRLCEQLLLIPHFASAVLPNRTALVTELGSAAARHVVATEAELNYSPTAWTPLPVVLLEKMVDHGAVVLSVAGGVPWMGGLLAGCAEETMAGWTSHLAIECLHWAEEFGARCPRTVPSIFGWSSPFNRFLLKDLPNLGRY